MTEAITSADTPRNNLLMVAAGGLVSGILTPLLPTLIDQIVGLPGQLRISLIAVPFAVLVFILIRRVTANPGWAAGLAAIITMVAFVCAVNAAIFIDGQAAGAARIMRYLLAGLTGGLVGTTVMALGIGVLPASAIVWPTGSRSVQNRLAMVSLMTATGAAPRGSHDPPRTTCGYGSLGQRSGFAARAPSVA